jgi:hypothetical protein
LFHIHHTHFNSTNNETFCEKLTYDT